MSLSGSQPDLRQAHVLGESGGRGVKRAGIPEGIPGLARLAPHFSGIPSFFASFSNPGTVRFPVDPSMCAINDEKAGSIPAGFYAAMSLGFNGPFLRRDCQLASPRRKEIPWSPRTGS